MKLKLKLSKAFSTELGPDGSLKIRAGTDRASITWNGDGKITEQYGFASADADVLTSELAKAGIKLPYGAKLEFSNFQRESVDFKLSFSKSVGPLSAGASLKGVAPVNIRYYIINSTGAGRYGDGMQERFNDIERALRE